MVEAAQQARENEFEAGTALPAFVRQANLETWNRYAAVNDEYVGIHMDDAEGRAAGYPGAIGMGNLIWAWLHATVEDWLGDRGRLVDMECRFLAPALKGDVIACGGVISDRRTDATGSTVLELELWADKQTRERLVTAKARVVVPG
jgi:hypothetical protein